MELAGITVRRTEDERLILEAATCVALDELTVRHAQLLSAATPVPIAPSGTSGTAVTPDSEKGPQGFAKELLV